MSEHAPDLRWISSGQVRLAVWEWPGDPPVLLFAHATGFHGRCWDHIVRRFPGRRALAFEFAGHGRSGVPEGAVRWPEFALNVVAVARHFSLRDAVGIGHSMGGHALVSAAAVDPAVFSALVLLDPVIYPRHYYDAPPPNAAFIRRRRNRWESADEMFERFRGRPPFATWDPEALRTYCDYALIPEGDSLVLACPPALEASIYERSNSPENDLYPVLHRVTIPVAVLRAGTLPQSGFDLNASPTAPDLAACFPQGRDVYLPDRNHYIPMEAPDLVVAEIASSC
jgi:pimeloyl-ACP methyl ester carboxylesterase